MESQSLDIGDEILITGPTTGIVQTTVSELRVNDRPTGRVKKGDVFSMLLDEKVRPSDKLYKLVDA